MKLEVGMYIRTDNGIIEKVNKIYDSHTTYNMVVWLNGYGDGKSVFIDDFEEVKHLSINARGFIKKEPSFDIIDLIEVGDYVNGYIVEEIKRGYDGKIWIDNSTRGYDEGGEYTIWKRNEDIKSVITHEQFEQMAYKVGE